MEQTKKQKRVSFSEMNEIRYMIAWKFAYRQHRISEWEQRYLDSLRFRNRIESAERIISPVLLKKVRECIPSTRAPQSM